MQIKIYNKNFDLTDSFRQYLEAKFQSLEKFSQNIIDFNVELSRDQHHNKGEVYTVEARIVLAQKKTLLMRETSIDARAAVDILEEKIQRQLIKQKDKQKRNWRSLKFWK